MDVETASTGSGGGGQRDRRGSGATSRSSSPPTESEAERYDVDSESENAKVRLSTFKSEISQVAGFTGKIAAMILLQYVQTQLLSSVLELFSIFI